MLSGCSLEGGCGRIGPGQELVEAAVRVPALDAEKSMHQDHIYSKNFQLVYGAGISPALAAYSAARGDEARRIGGEVSARRAFEATQQTWRIG